MKPRQARTIIEMARREPDPLATWDQWYKLVDDPRFTPMKAICTAVLIGASIGYNERLHR